MNVSSVKNLNGEVFSAIQDASLTNVVQTNSGNWQDITAYQSNSASYLTAHQDLSDYYTTADANTLSSMLSGAIDYVSANAGDEFPVSADEAIQYVQTNSGTIDDTVTSYQTNSGTFLTAHQAISADEWNDCYDNINTNSGAWGGDALPITGRDGIDLEIDNGTLYIGASALTGAVNSYEQNSASYVVENNFEYDGNDLITAYNGSAFAGQGGGGDVPSGTMNVSGLEYNAVNEISAYNGSAIAQYGAEKQWLVHDDTLVHVSNSAQYALGCNISALQRLMGIDETVLFSGDFSTARKSISFSEPVTNFNSIKILWQHMNPNYTVRWTEYNPDCRLFDQIQGRNTGGDAAANYYTFYTYWTNNTTGMTFYYDIIQTNLTGGTATKTGGYNEVNPVKVIGIGRKEV